MSLLLAIDNGTQSLRVIAFTVKGEIAGMGKVGFAAYEAPSAGWAEQDVGVYWNALCQACQELWTGGVAPESISGVAVTTQRGSLVPLDQKGQPLHPAILWLDQRTSSYPAEIAAYWRLAFRLIGVHDTVQGFMADAESNWLRQFRPEIWRKCAKWLLISGYLNYRLSGEYVDSAASQVAYLPFDYRRHVWARRGDWKWRALGIDRHQLPKLFQPGAVMTRISEEAADQTGIPAGLPIIAAAADKACEILGSGCLEQDHGSISYGTTATFNLTSARYLTPARFLPPYPAAMPNHYCPEVQIFRGYWMVEWFKQEFGHPEREAAAETDDHTAEQLLERMIKDIPPGSEGLVLQPYWSPGVKTPGPEARGSIIGFTERHRRPHVYRAILEGLAYALRAGMERLERRSRIQIRELRVSGGGSQSDTALQITADVFNLPAIRPHTHETSALGAAICAGVGLGMYRDFAQAVAQMTREGRRFEPIAKHVAIYEELYRRIYRRVYPRLKPLFRSLSHLDL